MVLTNNQRHIKLKRWQSFVASQMWRLKSGIVVLMLVSCGSAPACAQRTAFVASRYNPAVLHIRFTPADGRTISNDADSFLDLTLIPSSGNVEGIRVELLASNFRSQLFKLYQQLSRSESLNVEDSSSPSRQLYELIFGNLDDTLKREKITTLLISADRGLQAVPFAALSDGQRFFGDRYAFAITPSLALMDFETFSGNQDRMLALGASEFNNLVDLPLVPQEIRGVGDSNKKDLFLDQEFTLDALLDKGSNPGYDKLHIATHAEFKPGSPRLSLLHSGVGPISMAKLSQLRKVRQGVPFDLVVFSACRTALGDEDAELGFSGLALQAGARSAVGTLWYVDDVATSAYFILMYRYLSQGVPKADAMQLTRQAFIRGELRLVKDQLLGPDQQPLLNELTPAQQRRVKVNLSNPFYWAGITLMGSPW